MANSSRGRRQRAKQGYWPAAAPYGYRRDADGRLCLGPDREVETVRLVFERYTNSHTSLRALAEMLNDRCIPSPTGRLWTEGRVRNLLTRHVYHGRAAFNRIEHTARGDVIRPESEWIWIEAPAIVSSATWQAAQQQLGSRRRATTPHRGGGPFLLAGLVHCGNCGARMVGGRRAHGLIYTCGNYNDYGRRGGCTCNAVQQEALVSFVADRLREALLADPVLQKLRERIRRKLTSSAPPDPRPAMREQLRRFDKEIKAQFRELNRLPDDLHTLAVEEIRGLQEARSRIAEQLEAYQPPRRSAPTEADLDRILGRLHSLRESLAAAEPQRVKHALAELVERIDLHFRLKSTGKHGRTELTKGTLQIRSCLFPTSRRCEQAGNLVPPITFTARDLRPTAVCRAVAAVRDLCGSGPAETDAVAQRIGVVVHRARQLLREAQLAGMVERTEDKKGWFVG